MLSTLRLSSQQSPVYILKKKISKPKFSSSKSIIETPEKRLKYFQFHTFLLSILLTLNSHLTFVAFNFILRRLAAFGLFRYQNTLCSFGNQTLFFDHFKKYFIAASQVRATSYSINILRLYEILYGGQEKDLGEILIEIKKLIERFFSQ